MSSLRTKWRRQRLALKKCLTRVYCVLLDEVSDMIEEEQSRKKRLWVRDWIGRRDSRGASTLLLKELAAEDVNEYKMCLRMTPEKFDTFWVWLLIKLRDKILKWGLQYHHDWCWKWPCILWQLETATALCNIFSEFRSRLFLTLYQKYAMQYMTVSGNS